MDDIKGLVTRSYDAWNARDRDSWLACCNEDITFSGPGGITGKGFDTGRMFWSLWQDPFPDNVATFNVAVTEGNETIHEGSSQARTRRYSTCRTAKTFPRRGRGWHSPIRWASLTAKASGQASGLSSTERSS
jgi:ketosteroid isomerase-like protein